MIIEKLRQLHILGSVVVMPDFFVDRIIRLESREKLGNLLEQKTKFGGGSIRGVPTFDIKGGNAVNVAYALSRLGVKATLFTVADEMGAAMLRQVFSKFGDKTSLRISAGKHGYTTAFEFPTGGDKVNVMVSDVGDNASFGPDKISSPEDAAILRNADAVMMANWASNLKGTELTEHAFRSSPSAFHFIDPADIETRKQDFRDSLKRLSAVTDCLSINENECNSLSDALGLGHVLGPSYTQDEVRSAAKKISEKIGISTDLHTRTGAAWSNGKESEFVHAIKVEPRILTGAGDVWDAADIIGYLAGLDPSERLLFSNACASLYVREPTGEPPVMSKVFELVERIQ